MDIEWRFSSPVDPVAVHNAGAFTLLPVRIHKNPDIAEEAAQSVLEDYALIFGDGREKSMPLSGSKLGYLCAFGFPEALPDRLRLVTRLVDIGLLHDGW